MPHWHIGVWMCRLARAWVLACMSGRGERSPAFALGVEWACWHVGADEGWGLKDTEGQEVVESERIYVIHVYPDVPQEAGNV